MSRELQHKKYVRMTSEPVGRLVTSLAVLGYVFAPGIIRVFRRDDAEVIRQGTEILRYQCLSFPLTAMIVMSNMYLQNIRHTVPAVIMATARQGLFLIPALFAGRALLGFLGVEIAQTVSDCCAFLLSLPLTITALRGMGKHGTSDLDENAQKTTI